MTEYPTRPELKGTPFYLYFDKNWNLNRSKLLRNGITRLPRKMKKRLKKALMYSLVQQMLVESPDILSNVYRIYDQLEISPLSALLEKRNAKIKIHVTVNKDYF